MHLCSPAECRLKSLLMYQFMEIQNAFSSNLSRISNPSLKLNGHFDAQAMGLKKLYLVKSLAAMKPRVEIRDWGHYRSPPEGKIIAAKERGVSDWQAAVQYFAIMAVDGSVIENPRPSTTLKLKRDLVLHQESHWNYLACVLNKRKKRHRAEHPVAATCYFEQWRV